MGPSLKISSLAQSASTTTKGEALGRASCRALVELRIELYTKLRADLRADLRTDLRAGLRLELRAGVQTCRCADVQTCRRADVCRDDCMGVRTGVCASDCRTFLVS